MFMDGLFSSDSAMKYRVNSKALKALTLEDMEKGFQITDKNVLVALPERLGLLNRLGEALEKHPEFFGKMNLRSFQFFFGSAGEAAGGLRTKLFLVFEELY
jgi:hypothetical protein